MPLEVHPDPLLIIGDNEPRCQASVKAPTTQDISGSSIPVGLKDSQDGSSKQDIPNKVLVVSTFSGPSTLVISISGTKDDRQNTSPKDVLVITISGTSSGSDGDHCSEFEEAPDIVPISSSDSFITETHKVITLEDEPTDLGSEPEVTSCHVAAGIIEETATSFASADMEDVVEGMRNLFSQQEEVMAIQKNNGSGLGSGRSYKVNYDKLSTSTPSTPAFASPSLVVPTRQDVNVESVNTDVNERPTKPFKYNLIEPLKYIPAWLHILDLL